MSPTNVSPGIEAKAHRYLAEGRLTIRERSGRTVEAICRGSDAEPYRLGYRPDEGWHCDCPAFRDCAHIHALKLVVATPPEGSG